MRWGRALGALLLALPLALSACPAAGPPGPAGPPPPGEKPTLPAGWALERAVGEAMAHRLIQEKGGLLASKELRRYLSLVGAAVARDSDRPDIPYHFGLLDSDEVSSFGLPGGFVFVTRGLLLLLDDEAELAAALAHEVAHVGRGHLMAHLLQLPALAKLADLTPDTFRGNPPAFDALVEEGMRRLLAGGLPREQTLDADRLAATFVERAGYDRGALLSFLGKLAGLGPGAGSVFGRIQPAPADRQRALAQLLAGRPAPGGGRLRERYQRTIRSYLF